MTIAIRKNIHITTEALAIFIVAPILIIFTIQHWNNINNFYKLFFVIFITLTILIDGYLLIQWFKNGKILKQ